MNFSTLVSQVMSDQSAASAGAVRDMSSARETLNRVSGSIPGGLTGGAVAGGIMALLVGNKSARKFAGKAASYGGAALLGGLAYKAYRNWQGKQRPQGSTLIRNHDESAFIQQALHHPADAKSQAYFQLVLIKAMIAAARADGNIDETERSNIFTTIEQMQLADDIKGQILDLFNRPITIDEIVQDVRTLEERAEVYLASFLVIEPDDQREQAHLANLSRALQIPSELEAQLRVQAQRAKSHAI